MVIFCHGWEFFVLFSFTFISPKFSTCENALAHLDYVVVSVCVFFFWLVHLACILLTFSVSLSVSVSRACWRFKSIDTEFCVFYTVFWCRCYTVCVQFLHAQNTKHKPTFCTFGEWLCSNVYRIYMAFIYVFVPYVDLLRVFSFFLFIFQSVFFVSVFSVSLCVLFWKET